MDSVGQIIMVIKEHLNDICSSSPVFVVVGPVIQVQVPLLLILAEGAALDLGDDQCRYCRGPIINDMTVSIFSFLDLATTVVANHVD